MKFSDIKGQKSFEILADAMELVNLIGDDTRFQGMVTELRSMEDKSGAWRVLCKGLPGIMRDEEYQKRILSILAAAKGVPYEEYAEDGNVLEDLKELFLDDSESLGFLAGAAAKTA